MLLRMWPYCARFPPSHLGANWRAGDPGWRPVKPRISAAFIGVRLAELRHAAGLTQVDLARKVGVSRATIANIEVGQSDPSLSVFAALVWALNADATTLLRQPTCSACGDRPPSGFACVTCGAATPASAGEPKAPKDLQQGGGLLQQPAPDPQLTPDEEG